MSFANCANTSIDYVNIFVDYTDTSTDHADTYVDYVDISIKSTNTTNIPTLDFCVTIFFILYFMVHLIMKQ